MEALESHVNVSFNNLQSEHLFGTNDMEFI